MSCFPFFIDIAGKSGLIVGGGKVALRKIEKLLPFGCTLTVIAPEILPAIEATGVHTIRRTLEESDITDDVYFVIAASNDPEVNRRCGEICRKKRILFNVVSEQTADMFVFPALYSQGPLTVGVTTAGASPTAARWVRDRIEGMIPDRFGAILDQLAELRSTVLCDESDRQKRESVFKAMFSCAIEAGRPLTEEEIRRLL